MQRPAGVQSTAPLEPCPKPVTESGSPFRSVSFASTSTVFGVFTSVTSVSVSALGGLFGTPTTVTCTVAVAVPPLPSEAV